MPAVHHRVIDHDRAQARVAADPVFVLGEREALPGTPRRDVDERRVPRRDGLGTRYRLPLPGRVDFGAQGRRGLGRRGRHLEAETTAADQQLLLVTQDHGRGPDEGPVGALQVLEIPAALAVLEPPADLRVPTRDPAIMGDQEVPFGPADDERAGADPQDFARVLAVVEHAQQGHRGAQGRSEGNHILCRLRGAGRDVNRLPGGHRAANLTRECLPPIRARWLAAAPYLVVHEGLPDSSRQPFILTPRQRFDHRLRAELTD